MEDAPSRVQFAGLLGGQLGRQVDIRGVRLREDVAGLVTAALSVAGGNTYLSEWAASSKEPRPETNSNG
ncbi:hypothetical protein SVIOM74S_07288 [Streptomyces violarus]